MESVPIDWGEQEMGGRSQRRFLRQKKRRYHPVGGVDSSDLPPPAASSSSSSSAAAAAHKLDVEALVGHPEGILQLLESNIAAEREIGCAAIASMSFLDPESCLEMFQGHDGLLEGLLRLLSDPSSAVRAVCAGSLRNLADGPDMSAKLMGGGVHMGVVAALRQLLVESESNSEEKRLGAILAGLDLLLLVERLCEESDAVLDALVECQVVDLLVQVLALHEMDAGLSLSAAMCLHVVTDGCSEEISAQFSADTLEYMMAMVKEEDMHDVLRVTVAGVVCNLEPDSEVVLSVLEYLADALSFSATDALDQLKPHLQGFTEREHILEIPKFLSMLSQGAGKQSFIVGLSEKSMAAFIEVEQWFASALAQRLALETVGNLAALEGQDGEEEEGGVTFSLRQDAAAEFMDQSGMVKQVVEMLHAYLPYSVAGASVEFEEEAALTMQQLQLRSLQFLGNALLWAENDLESILKGTMSLLCDTLEIGVRDARHAAGHPTHRGGSIPTDILEECVQLSWTVVERDAKAVEFGREHLQLFVELVGSSFFSESCRARGVSVLGCVGAARVLPAAEFKVLSDTLAESLRSGQLLVVGEALNAVYSCFSEDDANEYLGGERGIVASMEALVPEFDDEVAKRIEELSDEEVASMEEARDNLVPFLEYKAAQPQ